MKCPRDCAGHGRCALDLKTGTPACECERGFLGADCAQRLIATPRGVAEAEAARAELALPPGAPLPTNRQQLGHEQREGSVGILHGV